MSLERRLINPLSKVLGATLALTMSLGLVAPAAAQPPEPAADLAIPGGPISIDPATDGRMRTIRGTVEIVVRLSDAPLAVANGANSKQRGGLLNRGQQQAYVRGLNQKQNDLVAQVRALGGVEVGRLTKALNAVIFSIDASQLDAVAALPGVTSVRRVGTYELDLSETVPYIGATAAQNAGLNGAGVTVAVLDSGIDYTHAALGGAGTLEAYEAAYGTDIDDPRNTTLDGLFPTAKVVGGYDFVGELWPTFGDRSEDPDPIDLEGHGTHVADIIAGVNGVAPGASLYAVKVCSAVSSSCNGVALLKGMEFSLDPNSDGDISDAVDVINMSLGSSYGQREDDLSFASANAVRAGVTVVASAGNSADRPYITGSPASTPEVISVAQTQVPGASTFALVINSPATIAGQYRNTETLSWAPIGAGFTGDVVFVGRGCNADPYLANPAGKVALIDRGACNISEKVLRASQAGATGILIGLVAAGDAVTFSNGGECPATPDGTCKPSLVIIQSTANAIKANIGAPVNVSVSPAATTPLIGSMVGSSARGPSYSTNEIKPDIGAPGASISAIAGTGTGTEPFGGTSGAAPMVAGSAALLIQKHPARSPAEIKSLLMNTADTNIQINPATQPGVLAPITRIGGGEVRVNRAAASSTAAWDADALTGSLSFGYHEVISTANFKRTVRIRNYSNQDRTYTITPGFRYADDAASGAVSVSAPTSVRVRANSSTLVNVRLRVDPARLPNWTLNGGSQGGNGALLQSVEFDGYLTISGGGDTVTMPWQIMPRKAAAVSANTSQVAAGGTLTLSNGGPGAGGVDVFALTGTSPRIGKAFLPGAGDNFAVIDLRSVGVRQVGSNVQFAINTFGQRAHPNYPAEFDVYIDSNRDGNFDAVIYNLENGGFGATGQNVVAAVNLNTGAGGIFFFADADLNSGNIILTAPLAALGLTPSTQFDFAVYAFDNYFTGNLTDAVEGMTFTLGTPKYAAAPGTVSVAPGGSAQLTVSAPTGGAAASPSQSGLLLMYRNARGNAETERISVTP